MFFSFKNDNRSSPKPKKSWHFRKRGQQNYKKKKVERRNTSELINKMIKYQFEKDEYQRIQKIKNINKIDNNDCKKRNGSAKLLGKDTSKGKLLKNLLENQGGLFFMGLF